MTAESIEITSITVDLERNVLLLHFDDPDQWPGGWVGVDQPGILDVGANGWLLGLEIDETYFPVADATPGTEHLTRTCEARVSLSDTEAAVVVPRRGAGYELSFPSGNQCWLRSMPGSGTAPTRVCASVASAR